MKRKIKLTVLVSLFLLFICAYTANAHTPLYEEEAQRLYDYELFKGSGNGFELDGVCDRLQGATMFVRLLGQENEALNNPKNHPFTDVNGNWSSLYIGQLYNEGYTKGISATEYGTGTMNANQFATFCLRALDYDDGVDFTYDHALAKMLELHIITEETYNIINNDPVFYRDYAVKLAHNTLAAEYKTRRTMPIIEKTMKDFLADKISEEELLTVYTPLQLDSLWRVYYNGGYDLSDSFYYNAFMRAANECREIMLMHLYRNGVVSKESLLKNIFIIDDNMILYTLPELNSSYIEPILKECKSIFIIKAEHGLGTIIDNQKAPPIFKPWEAYDDKLDLISTDPFNLLEPSFEPTSYIVNKVIYGPVRKCEYYLKGTHPVELDETEKYIVDFVQKEFLDKVTPDMTAYDKVMLANDFLRNNITYDESALQSQDKSFTYLFKEKKAVCYGFSQAFQFLMKLVDVECYIVDNIGVITLPNYHAWNIVRLDDGKLYNINLTGDPSKPFQPANYYAEYIDKETFYIDLTCSDPANIVK